jgi:hypothetical protein
MIKVMWPLEQTDLSSAATRCFAKWKCILDVPQHQRYAARISAAMSHWIVFHTVFPDGRPPAENYSANS